MALFIMVFLLMQTWTTFLSFDGRPRGFMINRQNEYGIASGEIIQPLDFFAIHQTPSKFVVVKDALLNHPLGVKPFHEPVKGSHFRFAVNSPAIGEKTLYLIDVTSCSMFLIDDGSFDLRGIGEGIGSKVPYLKDSGVAQDNDHLLLIHENIYERVEATVDIKRRAVTDVRVVRRESDQ
jgi:hypothetical protein